MNWLLAVLILLTLLLLVRVVLASSPLADSAGRALAFLAFFGMPVLITTAGAFAHFERAKTDTFCLSCHEMEPYGQSLRVDDPDSLPASHAQNRRVPRDHACYTCHTHYTMFGDMEAKLVGMKHLWVHFVRDEIQPGEIELYQPFHNRDCLHCHGGARNFVENDAHAEDLASLEANEVSCLDCHDSGHDVGSVASAPLWTHPRLGGD